MPVETGFGFFLSLSIFLLMDQTGIGVLCVSAALLHELGHLIAMALFRVKLVRVRLQTLEIGIERQEARSLMSELCIDLAGPAVNLLLAAVCWRWGSMGFSAINCALGLFELCPLPMLDGGQALYCLLAMRMEEEPARKWVLRVSVITLFPIAAAGFFVLVMSGYNITLLAVSLYLSLLLLFKEKS